MLLLGEREVPKLHSINIADTLGTYEPKRTVHKMMVVRLDSAQCNDGAEEHNGSVFRVTAVSGRQ